MPFPAQMGYTWDAKCIGTAWKKVTAFAWLSVRSLLRFFLSFFYFFSVFLLLF